MPGKSKRLGQEIVRAGAPLAAFAGLIATAFLCGCSTHLSPNFLSMNFDPNSMEVVGPATGENSKLDLGCMGRSFEQNSVITATKEAVDSRKADALVNVTCVLERGMFMLIPGLFCWQKASVYGTAIRFKPSVLANKEKTSEKSLEPIQQSVPVEKKYELIVNLPDNEREESLTALSVEERKSLTDYVLAYKGKKSLWNSSFALAPDIGIQEKSVIRALLSATTFYIVEK